MQNDSIRQSCFENLSDVGGGVEGGGLEGVLGGYCVGHIAKEKLYNLICLIAH